MKRKSRSASYSSLQNLERRQLFAAISLNSDVMNVAGSLNQSNQLNVSVDSNGRLWATADNYESSYLPSQVNSVNVTEGSANDQYNIAADLPVTVNLDNSNGQLIKTIPAGSAAVSSTTTQTSGTITTPNANAPVAQITTDSATTILPGQSVFVDGLSSTLNSGTYLTTNYSWDFGDPGSQYDQLVGWNAGHAYENPGTYTITLTVTNSLGYSSTSTQTVNVVTDNRQSIYVDAVLGSDSNNGLSASSPIKSLSHLNSILQPDEIVLFARGETFPSTSGVSADSNDTFDAYGVGTSPVLQWQGGTTTAGSCIFDITSSTQQGVVFQNLTFDTLNPDQNGNMPDAIVAAGQDVTVRNNTFLNIGDGVNANGVPDGLLVQGNQQPLDAGMQGYLVWFQGEDGVILGNTSENSTRQHNIRATFGFSRLLIEDNNLTNLNRTTVDPSDISKSCLDMQYGQFLYINGNTCTDGNIRLGPLNGNEIDAYPTTALSERETWVVTEDNTLIDTDIEVHPGTVNGVVRNNVITYNDAPAINVYGYDPTYQNIVQNVQILNNTIINSGTNGNAFAILGQTDNVTIANNLYLAPNFEPGYYTTTSPVYVDYANLSGLSFSNNIWPQPTAAQTTWWSNGGINYIGTDLQQDFYNVAAWNALSSVHNDIFSTVTVPVGYQATVNGVTAGANLSVAG